ILGADRYLGDQLGAERAVLLGATAAGLGDVGRDLGPDLVPESAAARGGERLQLHAALLVHDRDPGALLLGDIELDVEVLADRDQQAAAIDPVRGREIVGDVPGAEDALVSLLILGLLLVSPVGPTLVVEPG